MLDDDVRGYRLIDMNPLRDQASTFPELSKGFRPLSLIVALASGLAAVLPWTPGHAAPVGEAQEPVLEFIEPTNRAVFSTLDEIPIVLRAVASNDVFLTADVFANQSKIATVSYCCALCPCFYPMEGQELILQIPVPWQGGVPSPRVWQGWTNVQAGIHRLTSRAVGRNGSIVEAAPVVITVLDRTLRISVRSDGAVMLVIPQGSVVAGGFDLESSPNLLTWTRLGPFEPGKVAAFYFDVPPESARERRFYRSVYVPPHVP